MFNVGDKVVYNNKLYKVKNIKDDKYLKLQSVSGKTNEIIFNVPLNFVSRPIPVYQSNDDLEIEQIFPRGLRAKLPLYHDAMDECRLTNEELEDIIDKLTYNVKQRI